jgi:hypothetical protein
VAKKLLVLCRVLRDQTYISYFSGLSLFFVCARHYDAANNNLVGPLPEEISALYTLTQLELYNNKLRSTIPNQITNLTSIQVLDFENNQLTGIALSNAILELTT